MERLPRGESVVAGRSHCQGCGNTLSAVELIPVLSWVALRGRCRNCGTAIGWRPLLMELGTGTMMGLAAIVARDVWQLALLLPFAGVLLALALIDIEHRRLPNRIVYPSSAAACLLILAGDLSGGMMDIIDGALGALAFGGLLLLVAIVSRGGMGLGDVKFAGLIGLVLGAIDLSSVAVAAGAAIILGGLVASIYLLRGADRRSAVPFGPMLAAGATVAMLWGPGLAKAYLDLVL